MVGLALATILSTTAFAHGTFPSKPVRLIVPFSPGGTIDIIARAVSDELGLKLEKPMMVDNKSGDACTIAAGELVRSNPDGYALNMATVSMIATYPTINPNVGYDPLKDFAFVISIAATPNIISVHPSFPAKDYNAFLAELKKNPDCIFL